MKEDELKTGFFGIIIKKQTYKNMLYLLMSFPLGIFYFVFLVTGISLGIGLAIIWAGVFILSGVMFAANWLSVFERRLVISMLGKEIQELERKELTGGLFKKIFSSIADGKTWKRILYLFIKFPFGILNFVLVITLVSTSIALIGTPFYLQIGIDNIHVNSIVRSLFSSYPVLIPLGMAVGAFLLFISLHLFKGLAYLSEKLAKGMLN